MRENTTVPPLAKSQGSDDSSYSYPHCIWLKLACALSDSLSLSKSSHLLKFSLQSTGYVHVKGALAEKQC